MKKAIVMVAYGAAALTTAGGLAATGKGALVALAVGLGLSGWIAGGVGVIRIGHHARLRGGNKSMRGRTS